MTLYAIPVRTKTLEKQTKSRKYASIHRHSGLKIVSSFWTVSESAVLFLQLFLDFLSLERREVYLRLKEVAYLMT